MRQEAPIYRCPHTGMFFVFDYATIRAIAGNPDVFSNKFGRAMRSEGDVDPRLIEAQKEGYPPVDTMLTEDPPVHRRYSGLVNQAFTARRVATLEPDIEKIANDLIDAFIDDGTCEFVCDVLRPVADDRDRRPARRAALRSARCSTSGPMRSSRSCRAWRRRTKNSKR